MALINEATAHSNKNLKPTLPTIRKGGLKDKYEYYKERDSKLLDKGIYVFRIKNEKFNNIKKTPLLKYYQWRIRELS